MQNVLLTGILLASLIGSGAVVGYAAMNGHEGMHYLMHGGDSDDCGHFEDCDHNLEECEEQFDEECLEEHEDCKGDGYHNHNGC
jgi:hypothetical protein